VSFSFNVTFSFRQKTLWFFFCGSRKTLGPKTLGPKNSSLSKKNQRVLFRQKAEGFLVTPKGFGKDNPKDFGYPNPSHQKAWGTLWLFLQKTFGFLVIPFRGFWKGRKGLPNLNNNTLFISDNKAV